ncbi:MAG: hypothetical protein ACK52I_24340 [Pseudomonadota bacterium]
MNAATHADYRDRSWTPQPAAEGAWRRFLTEALAGNRRAAALADQLHATTAVRLRDVVDHVVIADRAALERLEGAGWSRRADGVLVNPTGEFPEVVPGDATVVWLRVEDVAHFLRTHGCDSPLEGAEHGPLQRSLCFPDRIAFGVLARRGYPGFDVPTVDPEAIRRARLHHRRFLARRRQFDTIEQGLAHTERLVDAAVADLGQHWACALWLDAERAYWMTRCPTGRRQKERQDRAGIGWANLDHHTYDGSRRHYRHTIRILEKLGYELREMLYAGELAGWGSQVLEQPVLKSTIFADVDLAPHEVDVDFAHEQLPDLDRHRRAGIVSTLHGESILEGGLNHVAGLYDQAQFRRIAAAEGVRTMPPFSTFPFLYQELTEGDVAAVELERVDALEAGGHLTAAEAEQIRLNGFIAAHLENIERNDGYKGFNRPGIDGVLRALDPRAAVRDSALAGTSA